MLKAKAVLLKAKSTKLKKNDPARIPFECSGQQWC